MGVDTLWLVRLPGEEVDGNEEALVLARQLSCIIEHASPCSLESLTLTFPRLYTLPRPKLMLLSLVCTPLNDEYKPLPTEEYKSHTEPFVLVTPCLCKYPYPSFLTTRLFVRTPPPSGPDHCLINKFLGFPCMTTMLPTCSSCLPALF